MNLTPFFNWNAMSAVGTVFAAVVALGIALREGIRRREEKREAARGLTLLLLEPLRDWHGRLKRLQNHVTKERDFAIHESFDEEDDALSPPSEVVRLMDRISELGPAAAPLSHGIHAARRARKMESDVQGSLKGDFNDAVKEHKIMSDFGSTVSRAQTEIAEAVQLMEALLERPA